MTKESGSTRRRGGGRERPRPPLGRDEILDAARRLIDQGGLDALSLRRVASSLGVTAAALYWHFRSKEDLVDAVIASVFADLTPPPRAPGPVAEPWTLRAGELYRWARSQLLERRELLTTPAFQRTLPLLFMKVGFAGRDLLREAGFAGDDLPRASRTLFWFTLGFTMFEATLFASFASGSAPRRTLDRAMKVLLPPDDLAWLARYLPHALEFDVDELFGFALDRLLEGLALEAARTRANPPARRTPAVSRRRTRPG